MTPADFTTGNVLASPGRACAAGLAALASLPHERIEAIRREVSAAPLGRVRVAPGGRPAVGIDARAYAHPLGLGADEFSRVERTAFVVVYAPERPRWHVARRMLREVVLPALAAHPSPFARSAAAILARRESRGAVLFAKGGELGPEHRGAALWFDVSLYSVAPAGGER